MAIVRVPIDKIDRIEMIEYKGGCSPKKIQQLYGCDIFVNGILFDNKSRSIITNAKCTNTGKQGYLFSEKCLGVRNGKPIWINKWDGLKDDTVTGFIGSAPTLIVDGKIDIDKKDITNSFYGTITYRSGIGFNDKELVLYSGGEKRSFSNYAKFAATLNVDYFLNLDGGGSCCLWKDGKQLNKEYDGRLIPMWVCIWLKKDKPQVDKEVYEVEKEIIVVDDVEMEFETITVNGKTYMEMRKLAETVDCMVVYDPKTKKKSIKRKK